MELAVASVERGCDRESGDVFGKAMGNPEDVSTASRSGMDVSVLYFTPGLCC